MKTFPGNRSFVVCLEAATNNRAATAFAALKRVTDPHGSEATKLCRMLTSLDGTDSGSFISRKSVHIQRIEHLWRDIRMCVTSHYYNTLHSLEAEHLLDVSSQEQNWPNSNNIYIRISKSKTLTGMLQSTDQMQKG
ncbi:hypothetical protein AMECASPLE_027187 [Ameca splendens]|uniref:Integrase core domain-containing protein n=1 Tax=Ameca splendens TaxID=208324 RepID=A0ABV0Y522_9TELE